ncbi:tRNA uridine-5-carboxymethylaminomethyl(34) synthesis GTPase MnmE [Natranaerobius trueperi]|uniref:tRNA modification GTPase MnmE n=1 Tax=Natranaerobius trueperi TaxID=759412 RepID=A0A226BZE7_9FIRM|nr:tRNA uridine-5-carboxymethylaminomethyl(34) synthesis GTPase MnmE [Natranaerobius trueperi]OWZ83477.1 tRNA uridine-5-carboxymethylaminomethyl(34) synthesis GTPase MnmE [Natranaerobius trueperi]
MSSEDTVAALSTPPGEGGIGIIRISGPKSFEIGKKLFFSSREITNFKNRKLYHGYIFDRRNNKTLDEVLITFMKGPYTYTCEDIVEIHCHGGMIPVREILQLIFSLGIRPSEPGEFTKRAFLNGRLDLTQAEAVMDLISTKTQNLKDVAMKQISGKLKEEISHLRTELITVLSNLEAKIDFPDEEIDVEDMSSLKERVSYIRKSLYELIESFNKGKIIREGVKTVIVGRPNVGKSSLLNILLGEERAIVTEIPGTTRDTLEEVINLDGIPLRIIDTAGIRESTDKVEQIGVKRTRDSMEEADIVLVVLDSSQELKDEDKKILNMARDKPSLIVLNKADLEKEFHEGTVNELAPDIRKVKVSALKKEGIDQLEKYISELVFGGEVMETDEIVITNERHYNSLKKTDNVLASAENGLEAYISEDLVSVDIKEGLEILGEITGESAGEDVIDEVFNNFCIGK